MKLRKIIETVLIWGFIIMSGSGCGRREIVIEDVKGRSEEPLQVTELSAGGNDQKDRAGAEQGAAVAAEQEELRIKVYVCGAVESPGVYELPEDSRICDAIELAGGYADNADLTGINPAQKLTDEQYIRIWTAEEVSEAEASGYMNGDSFALNTIDAGNGFTPAENGKINLNTASRDELMTLPGIGESKADAIIVYRQTHGAFSSIEEIMEISGIKNSVFNKIRDLITV